MRYNLDIKDKSEYTKPQVCGLRQYTGTDDAATALVECLPSMRQSGQPLLPLTKAKEKCYAGLVRGSAHNCLPSTLMT